MSVERKDLIRILKKAKEPYTLEPLVAKWLAAQLERLDDAEEILGKLSHLLEQIGQYKAVENVDTPPGRH